MAVICVFILALLLGYHYMNAGLFAGAVMMISLFLAILGTVAFGPVVVRYIEFEAPYRYAAVLAVMAVIGFGVIRAFLGPLDMDIDFHPVIERLGGAVTGLSSGLVAGGFLSVCLLCLDLPALRPAEDNMRSAGRLAMAPCRVVASMFPGEYLLTVDGVVQGRLTPRPAEAPAAPPSPANASPAPTTPHSATELDGSDAPTSPANSGPADPG